MSELEMLLHDKGLKIVINSCYLNRGLALTPVVLCTYTESVTRSYRQEKQLLENNFWPVNVGIINGATVVQSEGLELEFSSSFQVFSMGLTAGIGYKNLEAT